MDPDDDGLGSLDKTQGKTRQLQDEAQEKTIARRGNCERREWQDKARRDEAMALTRQYQDKTTI